MQATQDGGDGLRRLTIKGRSGFVPVDAGSLYPKD